MEDNTLEYIGIVNIESHSPRRADRLTQSRHKAQQCLMSRQGRSGNNMDRFSKLFMSSSINILNILFLYLLNYGIPIYTLPSQRYA